MPHHDFDATTIAVALELLTKHGFDGLARPLEMLFNEAMRLERDAYLGAGPWERSEDRRGWANNLKPKTLKSRVGDREVRVPKARGLDDDLEPFYPQSLERGSRIEQALGLALAEIYVQGVSTRKVKEITEQLFGREISSSQVSRLAAQLDEVLEGWRTRKLGSVRYPDHPFGGLDAGDLVSRKWHRRVHSTTIAPVPA